MQAGVLLAATGIRGEELYPFAREHFPFMNPSFTELTVIATASESVAPLASVESTVRVSEPLKFALPW